jgi:predicted Fe-Mo cluster-binding NifX family protein
MMRVAVSADGKDLDALIDPRFGRCAFFIVVETTEMTFEVFDNENIALGGGAGIQSAQFIADKGVEAIITGNCGPNAVKTLNAAGIKIILSQSGTVREAVEKYRKGLLDTTSEANVEDHYGASGGSSNPGSFTRGMGRCMGGGRGMGRGMGMRGGTGQGMRAGGDMGRSSDDELSFLKNQTEQLRRQIDAIESRVRNLEKQ